MKSVALHNLGCKVNAYEIDVMQQLLQENGYEIVAFDKKADIYIVNTCTVTNIADRKSRQMLHKAKKQNPKGIVVATGCYVQVEEEHGTQDVAVDLVIGNNKKNEIIQILNEFIQQRESQECVSKTLDEATVIDLGNEQVFESMFLKSVNDHTRAYIKIQDGCNQFCSYCIIPYARGRVRSRNEEEIIDEITRIAENGCKEVVLTGIHIASYGVERNQEDAFIKLLQRINIIDGIERIRLGSLEPRLITDAFVSELLALKKVCHHFHLSLQSGCDEVLVRMNRKYSTGDFLKSVKILKKAFADVAITTDIIVGFPGESAQEFEKTLEFVESVEFANIHVFPYSKRKGTVAASMKQQVPPEIAKERSLILSQKAERLTDRFMERQMGQKVDVLFEEFHERSGVKGYIGYTGNYLKVFCETSENLENCICSGKINKNLGDGLLNFSIK